MFASIRKPVISVILASFNHAQFVELAVRSVLDQTYKNIELIIVDDGSSDGTAEIIRKINDHRIKFYRIEKNRSVQVRNYALRHAKGKFIAFQNSDDVWAPDKLSRQLEVMESQPEVQAVFTGVSFLNGDGLQSDGEWAKNLFWFESQSQTAWLQRFFYDGNCLPLPSALVRKGTLSAIGGFRETLVQLSDFDLWIRLAARGTFVQVSAPLTQIRIQSTNLSRPHRGGMLRAIIELSRVLDRFTEPAQLAFYQEMFPDLPKHRSSVLRITEVAQHAASLGGPSRLLFADRTLEALFEDSSKRAEITEVIGAQVFSDFVERRRHFTLDWSVSDE